MQYFNSGLNPGIKFYILNEKNTTNPCLHPNSRVAGKTGRKNMYSSIIEVKKTVPWHWVDDEDPGENCDILKVLEMPVY